MCDSYKNNVEGNEKRGARSQIYENKGGIRFD